MADKAEIARRTKIQQEWLEGADIEMTGFGCPWYATDSPSFDWEKYEFRVKCKPLECWLNIFEDGSFIAEKSRERALGDTYQYGDPVRRAVRMIEAPED